MPIQSSNPPEVVTLEGWTGLNQSVARGSISDQEMWWSENLLPLGPGNLRAMWGRSAPLFTAPSGQTIVRLFGFDLNCTGYIAACLDSGDIAMVNLDAGGSTTLSGVWTPVAPNYPMAIKVWVPIGVPGGTQPLGGLLIGSAGSLYAWDGTTLTGPGQTAPTWLSGGNTMLDPGGSGQQVTSTLPSAGSLPNPIVGMEAYEGSMWVMGESVISFSAPLNAADYSTGDGGGSFPYQGDQLTCSYNAIEANSGILYLFGDSSVDSVSYVQTQGTPPVTTFSRINVDPQTGQQFPREVAVWGRAFALHNTGGGIYVLYGGATQWIAQKVVDLLARMDTSAYLPTQCAAHIFGRKVVLFNARLEDPWGQWRNLILVWMGDTQEWTVASQGVELTNIACHERNSFITPYGTDGQNVYQLFAEPDPTLPKRLSTRSLRGKGLTTIKNWTRVFLECQDNGHDGVSFIGSFTTRHGGIPNGVSDIGFEVEPGGIGIIPQPIQAAGITGELDLTSESPDFTLERIHLYYSDRSLFGA